MDPATTEKKFLSAVDIIKSLPKSGSITPSNETKLKFYSYFKQATEGPCEIPKPGFWDIVNRAKWDAWNKLGNMSKEEAMQNYVKEFVQTLQTHSIDDLEDPSILNDFVHMMGPFIDLAPKEVRDSFIVANGKGGKVPLNNNSEDVYPSVPINGHNLNGNNNDSDSDEFSDTLERVNEDESIETPNSSLPLLSTKGPTIVSVRGGGDHGLGGADGNSPAGGPGGVRNNRFARQADRSSDYPLPANPTSNLIGGAGGSRRSGGDVPLELSPDVGEQLAMAVIRLQHIMEQVVVRLDSLETLIIQKNSSANAASKVVSTKNASRWTIFGISPKLAIIILAWPFIAQWLMYLIRKRQRHLS